MYRDDVMSKQGVLVTRVGEEDVGAREGLAAR